MRWLHSNPQEEQRLGSHEARYVLIVLTLASTVGVFMVLRPYLHSIILAFLLVSIFSPVHQWLRRKLSGKENVASFLSVTLVFLLVVVPISVILSALVKQGIDTIQAVNSWVGERKYEQALQSDHVQRFLQHPRVVEIRETLSARMNALSIESPDLPRTILRIGQGALEFTGTRVVPILRAGGSVLFGFFIMLFVMFFAFRDGPKMLGYVLHLSPLTASQEQALIDRIKEVSRAVLLGVFITAACQGLAAMIGFKIVGIPAFFWGAMLAFTSLIPLVGTALVWVPAVCYLLLFGRMGAALFLTLWCIFVVGAIDNFLRPILMGGRVGMSAVVIFLAILGGLQCFGPIGIVYGPLVFGLCAVCLYIYELENARFLSSQDRL